jgi:hypothetical protein
VSEAIVTNELVVDSSQSRGRSVEPVGEKEHIVSIDTLSGLALLGILPMNIQYFSMNVAAYFNPTAYGNLSGANRWVWGLSRVLADEKFITIFSMLFGAGILLRTSRVEAAGRRPAPMHYRRMGWLTLFPSPFWPVSGRAIFLGLRGPRRSHHRRMVIVLQSCLLAPRYLRQTK